MCGPHVQPGLEAPSQGLLRAVVGRGREEGISSRNGEVCQVRSLMGSLTQYEVGSPARTVLALTAGADDSLC